MNKILFSILSLTIVFQLVGCSNSSSINKEDSISEQFKKYKEKQNILVATKNDNQTINDKINTSNKDISNINNITNNGKEYVGNNLNKNIINKAYNVLDNTQKSTIEDLNKTKIEEFKTDKVHIVVGYTSMTEDLKNRDTYKITFITTQDKHLGPLTVYVDKENLEVIGREIRN